MRPAPPERFCAPASRGDRVALMCGNRLEFVRLMLGSASVGAVPVPIDPASRGPQIAHISCNSGARLLAIEAEFLAALDLPIGATALETLGSSGEPGGRRAWPAASPLARAGDDRATRRRRPRRHLHDTLHLRHDRPIEGRRLSAWQYYWWGGDPGRHARRREGECSTRPAAVPQQCVELFLPGVPHGRPSGLPKAFLGLGFLAGSPGTRRR